MIEDKIYSFNTDFIQLADNIEFLSKRQLYKIEIKRKFEEKVMFEPGYSFEYYNKNDGVQLGNDGFSEKNKVYQASNGAVYGLIKKIQYPTGRCEKYSYSENRMSSVPLDLEENIYNLKKQKQVISPYGTHVILRLFNDNRYTINVYKYSVQGWFANELFSGETTEAMFDAYDTDIYVDFTDNDLVITSLDYLTVKVYRLSNSVINK